MNVGLVVGVVEKVNNVVLVVENVDNVMGAVEKISMPNLFCYFIRVHLPRLRQHPFVRNLVFVPICDIFSDPEYLP